MHRRMDLFVICESELYERESGTAPPSDSGNREKQEEEQEGLREPYKI